MKTIEVNLAANGYPVYLGRGILEEGSLWRKHLGGGKILVVSNDIVAPLYLEAVRSALGKLDFDVHVIPDGEQIKTAETWCGIIDKLIGMQARRDTSIIALGGGVVGDITGFAAACYMRGVRFLQAPTTLLAQVDASVGGKTAINHVKGKNLIGAFHQPATVIIDSATLDTLPVREFNAGMAEVIKYGAIRDPRFFSWLEDNADAINERDADAVDHMICRSVQNKAEIVALDEKEAGVRALLNFGHSFGHALEAETAFSEFLHGEAVAIGMVTATILSESRGLCAAGTAQRLSALLDRFDLPIRIPPQLSIGNLAEALELDKKALVSGLRLILLNTIGKAIVDNQSTRNEIIDAMKRNAG